MEFFKEHEQLACGIDTRLSAPSEPVAISNGRAKPGRFSAVSIEFLFLVIGRFFYRTLISYLLTLLSM